MGYTESASSPADRPAKLSCSMLLIVIQHPVEALHAGIANADASSDNSAGTMVRTLTEQYSSCQTVLLSMLQERRTSGLQLACLNAIMDFTRAGIAFHSNQFCFSFKSIQLHHNCGGKTTAVGSRVGGAVFVRTMLCAPHSVHRPQHLSKMSKSARGG